MKATPVSSLPRRREPISTAVVWRKVRRWIPTCPGMTKGGLAGARNFGPSAAWVARS
jgi:hypothetical protein